MSRYLTSKPNLVDRVVSYLDPVAAQKRMKARTMLAIAEKWTGGSHTRRATQEWNPIVGSADADLLWDLETLRTRSRDLVRNSCTAGGAINSVVSNAVGRGMKPKARIDYEFLGIPEPEAEAWENKLERLWENWANSRECDATRTQNFYELQGLVFRSILESGDVFTIPLFVKRPGSPFGLKVQVVEADRVRNKGYVRDTNELAGGVEMDALGAPTAYHILKTHPGAIAPKPQEWDTYNAFTPRGTRKVHHHYDKLRPGLTRGYPYLAPVIESLKQLETYTEAELMAAVVSGMFTVFVETESAEGFGVGMEATSQASTTSTTKGGDVKLGVGTIVDLAPGEKVSTSNPGRPNAAFDPFVLAILRQIGARLELPFEVLVKHFTSSYTAARAALLDAWRFFYGRRTFLARSFCQPYFEAFIEECIARELLDAPGFFDDPMIRSAYCRANWIGDAPGQVDPTKEVEAAALRCEAGFSTIEAETIAMNGGDWEENHRQQVKEFTARKADGLLTVLPTVAISGKPNPQVPPGDEGGNQPMGGQP